MTNIDLDELKNKARAALGKGQPRLIGHHAAEAHLAANPPQVTLALIARISELEEAAGVLDGIICRNIEEPQDDRRYCDARAVLEKGAVLA